MSPTVDAPVAASSTLGCAHTAASRRQASAIKPPFFAGKPYPIILLLPKPSNKHFPSVVE